MIIDLWISIAIVGVGGIILAIATFALINLGTDAIKAHNARVRSLEDGHGRWLRELQTAFDCHTKDNKKDMKPLRKQVDKLEARLGELEQRQENLYHGLLAHTAGEAAPAPKEYQVTWVADITADSPEEAAQQARDMQRDPSALCGHFYVEERQDDELGDAWEVDLDQDSVLGPMRRISVEEAVKIVASS